MFVNLHSLPAGQHMYTIYIAIESYLEEVDVVASSRAQRDEIVEAAMPEIADLYGTSGWTLAGIADQSSGEVIYKADGAFSMEGDEL